MRRSSKLAKQIQAMAHATYIHPTVFPENEYLTTCEPLLSGDRLRDLQYIWYFSIFLNLKVVCVTKWIAIHLHPICKWLSVEYTVGNSSNVVFIWAKIVKNVCSSQQSQIHIVFHKEILLEKFDSSVLRKSIQISLIQALFRKATVTSFCDNAIYWKVKLSNQMKQIRWIMEMSNMLCHSTAITAVCTSSAGNQKV